MAIHTQPAIRSALMILLFLALASVAVLGSSRGDSSGSKGITVPALELPGRALLAGGERTNPSAAEADTSFHVHRPNHSLASDENLKAVWIRHEAPREVALEYISGLRVYVRPAAFDNPEGFYRTLQAQGIPGTIREIDGVTAFVVPAENSEGAPGSVDMVLGTIEVSLVGHGSFTTEQLIEIARSVK